MKLYLGTHPTGEAVTATVWQGLLLLKRNEALGHPFVRQCRGRFLVGGLWWRELPHQFLKNPLSIALYPDTLMNALTRPLRPWLLPGKPAFRWLIKT